LWLESLQNIVVKNIEVSGEMHRYIPVLAKNAGFGKLEKKVVQHQARKYGETKFEWNVYERFSGFNYHLVPFSFWKETDAPFGHGILDVHYRIYACWLYWYFKIIHV
jgi:hypothetical protein